MGLKTTNYEIKSLGLTLPEAYAVIKKMQIDNGEGYAEIAIQTSRENAFKLTPITVVRINFTDLERDVNPYEAIYAKAKEVKLGKKWNVEKKIAEDCEYPGPFTGWEDDIVEE